MPYLLTGLLAAVPLLIAAYAHGLLGRVAKSRKELWTSRLLLLGVGSVFGLVMAFYYLEVSGLQRLLVFLGSFGITHVPAAAILFIKSRAMQE